MRVWFGVLKRLLGCHVHLARGCDVGSSAIQAPDELVLGYFEDLGFRV